MGEEEEVRVSWRICWGAEKRLKACHDQGLAPDNLLQGLLPQLATSRSAEKSLDVVEPS